MSLGRIADFLLPNRELLCNSLGGMMVVWGTYLLSKNVFEKALKKLVNFEYQKLPLLHKMFIRFFGSRKAFEDKTLWESETYPSDSQFTKAQKRQLSEPFWGFFIICVGSFWAVFGYRIVLMGCGSN